jgi:acetyl esterase
MTLDPQAQVLCDAMNAAPRIDLTDATLEMQRFMFGQLLLLAGEREPVAAVDEHDADGVPVRVYRPADAPAGALPVVFWIHGGGWTIGSVEQYDPIVRQIANGTGALVVSPDYRLAPEHPFPAPLDDCWNALQWTERHMAELGGDASRIAIGGDSAGGNLSAVCALLARDAGGPALALQALVYPVTDADLTTASYRANGDGYLLDLEQMRWFFDCYTRGGVDASQWRISPLRVPDVRGVAPALVITGEYDPLRDEGEAYAQRLRDAGVEVEGHRYPGMVHAFFGLSLAFDASKDAVQRVATALRRAFGTLA